MAPHGAEASPLVLEPTPLPEAKPDNKHYLALLTVPLLWGTFAPALKLLLNSKAPPPPLAINLVSHGVATLALMLLLKKTRTQWSKSDINGSLELGFYLFCGQMTQLLGLNGTKATTNAIFVQSAVIIVPAIELVPEIRRTNFTLKVVRNLIPSFIALFGIVLVTTTADDDGDGDTFEGVAYSLVAAFFYALHTIRVSAIDTDPDKQALGQVAVNFAFDVLALPFAASSREWLFYRFTGKFKKLHNFLLASGWNGIMVSAFTTWAMSYAQSVVDANTAALAYAMEPVFAAVLAWMFLGDTLTGAQTCGAILVVCANIFSQMTLSELLFKVARCLQPQSS